MKKIVFSAMTLVLVLGLVGAGAFAQFNDTETSTGNTFTAGTLDLKVDGGDNPIVPWSASNLKPGDGYWSGFKTLKNVGSISGTLTVTITNLVCNENGLEEPEIAAGDSPGVQMNHTQAGGYGELWDQIGFLNIVLDDNGDGKADRKLSLMYVHPLYGKVRVYWYTWDIPIDIAMVIDDDFEPGEEVGIQFEFCFYNSPGGTWDAKNTLKGVPNNAAMGDSIEMDLVFDLVQN